MNYSVLDHVVVVYFRILEKSIGYRVEYPSTQVGIKCRPNPTRNNN
jgi:hypothetical protein